MRRPRCQRYGLTPSLVTSGHLSQPCKRWLLPSGIFSFMSANYRGACHLTQTCGCETSTGFKNGPHLHSGSQAVVAAGRTRQTVASWRPGQTPPQRPGDGWCANTLSLKQFKQRTECFGLDSGDVFRPLKVLPGQNVPCNSLQKCLEQGEISASGKNALEHLCTCCHSEMLIIRLPLVSMHPGLLFSCVRIRK